MQLQYWKKFSGSLLTNFTQNTIRSLTLLPVTLLKVTLREKCPNTEFFLVCIFPYLYWLRGDILFLSVFSPKAGKYRPEKNSVLGHFSRKINYFAWFFFTLVRKNRFLYGILLHKKSIKIYAAFYVSYFLI